MKGTSLNSALLYVKRWVKANNYMVAVFLTIVCCQIFKASKTSTEEVANCETVIQTCAYSPVKDKIYE